MKWLAVLYDDECGICSRIRRWLEKQPVYVPLKLVPFRAPITHKKFVGIDLFFPEQKLVVVSDEGAVWRGDSAWIMLLWALVQGRELSMKMASPTMRPLARKVVTAVSANRLRLSKWLRLTPDRFPNPDCSTSSCKAPPLPRGGR